MSTPTGLQKDIDYEYYLLDPNLAIRDLGILIRQRNTTPATWKKYSAILRWKFLNKTHQVK